MEDIEKELAELGIKLESQYSSISQSLVKVMKSITVQDVEQVSVLINQIEIALTSYSYNLNEALKFYWTHKNNRM